MLLDSNIIIYAAQAEHATLRQFIAGTAVEHGRILVTHNTDDFRWISEIKLLDPLAERP
jgi:hypothetical protein